MVAPDRVVEPVETTPTRTLVLLRHGRTAWNLTGRAQGHADVELDDVGHAQAAAAAAYLAGLGPARLWSSDLLRARSTAAYLEKETGLAVTEDSRLREFDVGDREGMTIPEFAERYPGPYAAWRRGEETLRVPGSETTDEVRERCLPALREALAALDEGQTGIVVGHGAALKVGVVALLGWPAAHAVDLRGLDNCAWATLEEREPGGRLRLTGYNGGVAATAVGR